MIKAAGGIPPLCIMINETRPEWGRFINADSPAVPTISPESSTSNKNSFAYCDNNPVNRVDYEGQCPHILIGAVVGGVVGFASTLISDAMAGEPLSLGKCMISAGFGAGIALNALFGAGESVALDLYDIA